MVRIAVLLLALAVVALTGCGGGTTTPEVRTGDYFPTAVGTHWLYALQATVETDAGKQYDHVGLATVDVARDTTIAPAASNLAVFASNCTLGQLPSTEVTLTKSMRRFVDFLFAANGGLRPSESFYRSEPHPTVAGQTREVLRAVAYGTHPQIDLAEPYAYFNNPPLVGAGFLGVTPFVALPLAPPNDHVEGQQTSSKVVSLPPVATPLGPREAVLIIENCFGYLVVDGARCAFSGRVRLIYAQDVGLCSVDYSTTLNDGSTWARVSQYMTLTNFTAAN